MRVDLGRFRIEPCDEFPLLDGFEVLLALDNDDLVCPDGVAKTFDVGVYPLRISFPIPMYL